MKMKIKKIGMCIILFLLVMSVVATAVEAKGFLGGLRDKVGGGKKKSVRQAAAKVISKSDERIFLSNKIKEYEDAGATAAKAREQALKDLVKYKAEKYAKDLEAKVGGYIGGALRGVFGVVGSILGDVIEGTPIQKTKDEIMDRVKFKTDIIYKVEKVKKENEQLWEQACEELKKLGEPCVKPTKKPEKKPEKKPPKKPRKKSLEERRREREKLLKDL